ncbi:Pentatricopeptide repeat-containing protein MRL1 [Phytophthora citrophthora]|uniref:Pentatricopeptide repeat-containing protein MRL1 n=1 Tax=Phytophthora citrophthora TaxID=4793 RepID=A0AAD9GB83_9STRA|nr:Pentatricopeptide repeat-containing protein MRL1 [Phytophthora citrophthora]
MKRFLQLRVPAPSSPLYVRWQSSVASPDWRQAIEAFQRKASDNSRSLTLKDVASVVHVCTQSDRTREALDAIRRGEKRGITAPLESHVQICCSWARKGQAERALAKIPELWKQFQLTTNQLSVYDSLLSVFKAKGDWRSTHAAIAQMNELGITPNLRAFRVLMLTAAKAKQKDMLMATVQFVEKKFPGIWTDVATLTAMCQALVDVGENQRVMEIYRKLDDNWIREEASTMLFNNFLLAALRNGDKPSNRKGLSSIQSARDIFDRMQEALKAVPDDFTFSILMMELAKRSQWTQVLDLFNTMLETQARSQNGNESVINALSCSAVIRALHKLHEAEQSDKQDKDQSNDSMKEARQLKDQKRKLKQDLSVVMKQLRTVDLRNVGHASTLIDTLDEFRLFTAARQVFKRVLDEGVIQKTPWRLKDGFEIDLHTFSRGVAKCAVVSAFEEITRSQQGVSAVSLAGNAPLQDLRIITGVGKRSQTFMKPVLRQEITELLTKSNRPPLWPSPHPTNPGVLLVRHNALRKWLKKGGAIRYF